MGDQRATPTGVVLDGPWTWQGRAVEDVVSALLMESDSIANLEERATQRREREAAARGRTSPETQRTAEHFTAALAVIRARQRAAGKGAT